MIITYPFELYLLRIMALYNKDYYHRSLISEMIVFSGN